eukprot:685778-Amphidinium_carterae.1
MAWTLGGHKTVGGLKPNCSESSIGLRGWGWPHPQISFVNANKPAPVKNQREPSVAHHTYEVGTKPRARLEHISRWMCPCKIYLHTMLLINSLYTWAFHRSCS